MALSVCLRKLEKAASIEDRVNIYKFLQNKKRLPALCSNEKYTIVLTNLVLKDVASDTSSVLQLEALHTLHSCLCCEHVTESLNTTMQQKIASTITNQARSTEQPEMYTELICVLSQLVVIMPEVMSTKLPEILECLERHFVKQYAPYDDVLCKVCLLLQRLITEIANSMIVHMEVWTPWIFFPLCHENKEIREVAMKNLELCFPIFSMMEKTVLPIIVGSIRSHLSKEMKMMYLSQKEYILMLWGKIVTVLGVSLHRSSPFINSLLEIVELAMKSDDEVIFIEALKAWKCLISNFAANLDTIGNNRRLKLLLQPLKCNILATERVAVAKCETWWYIIWSLDEKLNSNFEMVCVPLLQYTFSSPLKNADVRNSPATTRSGAKGSSEKSVKFGPKTDCMQKLGCEILSRLLEQPKWGSPGGLHSPKKVPNISLMPLKSFISSHIYVHNATIFIHAAKIALSVHGHNDNYSLLNQYILQLLTSRTARLAKDREESSLEAISKYFQFISDLVTNKLCKINYLMKLLVDLKMFPKEQMLTQIPRVEHNGKVYNTPLLVVCSIMFEILKSSSCNDWCYSTFKDFLSMSQSMVVPLSFTGSVMKMLKQITTEFSCDAKVLCKIWSYICLNLSETIEKTQEVNQSSDLSCDFTSTAMVLSYPLQHFLTSNVLQVCDKQVWKNWCDLYKAFARCSALVPTAEANVACHIVANMMQEYVSREDMQVFAVSLTLCQLMETIVNSIDYAALGRELSEGSPSSWLRRSKSLLHNITSFITVVGNLLSVFSKLVEECQSGERKKDNKQILETTGSLMAIVQKLIANVTTSSLLRALIVKLLPHLVPFFSCSSKKQPSGKTYSAQFQQHVEELWGTILTSFQLHYSGPYDTEFLESICPLLEVNLLNSHRSIVERTRQFWHATFGCNIHNLALPLSFKNTLRKVRPPLIPDIDVGLIEDTSSSFLSSQEITDDTLINKRSNILRKLAGITDYQKKQSSLLLKQKPLSTDTVLQLSSVNQMDKKQGKSASVKNYKKKSTKKLLDDNDEAFVVIMPQKKRQVLTEHQKEMKRKRRYVPAMYNDLSQETPDSQSFSQSFLTPPEVETITVHSSAEDADRENKTLNEEKGVVQEPEVIIVESEDLTSTTTTKQGLYPCTDGVSPKMSIPSKEKNREAEQDNLKLQTLSPVVGDINMGNIDQNNRKSCHQEGSMSERNVIQETDMEDVAGNYLKCEERTMSDRLLVEDKAKDLGSLTPLKQGILRLIKNKNRLSNIFPQLGYASSEVESDLDENDAIPSSQDSPNNSSYVDKPSRSRKQVSLAKSLKHHSDINKTCSINKKDASNAETVASTEVAKSHVPCEGTKISQCSEALLSELGGVSSLSSKGSSEESIKIITESCARGSVANLKISKPISSTIDLTEDASPKDEVSVTFLKQSESPKDEVGVTSLKQSNSPSQDNDSSVLQSMQFSISSNSQNQPSVNLLGSSSESCKSNNEISINKELNDESPESFERHPDDLEPKRQSHRRSTSAGHIQEMLQTKNKSLVNYKELLQSHKKTYDYRQELQNSSRDDNLEKPTDSCVESDDYKLSCHVQPLTTLCEGGNSPIHSSVSPTVNRVLFQEKNHSYCNALHDLLTKPITIETDEIGMGGSIGKVEAMEQNQNHNIYVVSESSNRTLVDDKCQIIKENRSTDKQSIQDENFEDQSELKLSIASTEPEEKSPQSEQEQTPDLKSPVLPLTVHARHSQRQKVVKVGKLKSIELEKLFPEIEKKSTQECCSATDSNSFDSSVSTDLEKPKGARKRKSKIPSPSSNLTSPVATRLRARGSAAKQRAIQKSCIRGRPKSRSSTLGIAHRHKPKRLSSVSVKSPTKIQAKDEEKLGTNQVEKEGGNLNATEMKNSSENREDCEKQEEAVKTNGEKESPRDKVPLLETKTVGNDAVSRDERMMKILLPDPSRKRPLADIKNYKTTQHSFSLPISPLSRSQKILRAAIGNFSSVEKSLTWKSSKYNGSPKNTNIIPDNSSPESVKFSPSLAKQPSPFASPSTGILKKRKMTEDNSSSSPSPPQKQRKVSFADPIVQSSISVETCSPDERLSKPVKRCLEMPKAPITVPEEKNEVDIKDMLPSSDSSMQTSEEYQITPLSQYDTDEKVFPYLSNCDKPVEVILPYLTCSLFPTGLGQLLRARNIFTIGDFCSLTIPELLRLPVKSPKLETVRKAMHLYMEMFQKEKLVTSAKEQTEPSKSDTNPEIQEELVEGAEEESSNVEHASQEKQHYMNETVYMDTDEDLQLTPMPDSDNEDAFFSFGESSQRCEVESFVEADELQNIACDSTVSENNVNSTVCEHSQSNKAILSNSDYPGQKNSMNVQNEKVAHPLKNESHVGINSSSVCNKEENKMKGSSLNIESQNSGCEHKSHDGISNSLPSSSSAVFSTEECHNSEEQSDVNTSQKINDVGIHNEDGSQAETSCAIEKLSNVEVACVTTSETATALSNIVKVPLHAVDAKSSVSSEIEIKHMHDGSLAECNEHHSKNSCNMVSNELQVSNNIFNTETETQFKEDFEDHVSSGFANEQLDHIAIGKLETTNNDLNIIDSEEILTSVQNHSFHEDKNCTDDNLPLTANEHVKGSTDLAEPCLQNDANEDCPDHNKSNSEFGKSINIMTAIETEKEQSASNDQNFDSEVMPSSPEHRSNFDAKNELYHTKEKCILDRQDEYVVGRSAENAPSKTISSETIIPRCCDSEDVIETVNNLISKVVKENIYEEIVSNNNNNASSASESTEQTKTSGEFQLESKMCEIFNQTVSGQHIAVIEKPGQGSEKAVASAEGDDNSIAAVEVKISSTEDAKAVGQSETELLQALFTVENLRKTSLLQLADMLDKLSAVIRIKSEEISNSSDGNRH